jgi:biotin carboxyl carrier protein
MAESKQKGKKRQAKKLIALSASGKEFEFRYPLEKIVKYQGEKVKLKLYEDPQGFSYIVWKNKKYWLDIIEKSQNKYTVMMNGVWHTFSIETPFSLKRKKNLEKQAGASSAVAIHAPMPGKIIDVLVENDKEVNAGEPLIILEAMKMQNEINCPVDGVITSVHIRKNDSVMKDDLLIEIERK